MFWAEYRDSDFLLNETLRSSRTLTFLSHSFRVGLPSRNIGMMN